MRVTSLGISVVVPVYNEHGNVRPFLGRMEPLLEMIGGAAGRLSPLYDTV
jgi:hypothetical protein